MKIIMPVHLHVSSVEELEAQLENPTAEAIRSRAIEVFGNESKASGWLGDGRSIFGGQSPNDIAASGDPQLMRKVLVVLGRIENGIVG